MAKFANEKAGSDRPPQRWLQNPLRPIFAKHQSPGTIRDVEMVTASMKRLVIEADAVSRWDDNPGHHVRVQINDPLSLRGIVRPSETLRTYTVWDTWPQKKRFEIRAHLFDGEGVGRRWIEDATAGEQFVFWGPMGAKDLPPGIVLSLRRRRNSSCWSWPTRPFTNGNRRNPRSLRKRLPRTRHGNGGF